MNMDKINLNTPNLVFLVLAVLFLFSGNISLQIVAVVVVAYNLLKGNFIKKSSNVVDLNNLKMSDAAVLFEKKYQEISELLYVYLEIYFKKAFETPKLKALNYPEDMHSTMAARVVWYLLGNNKDEINLNIDDKEKNEYIKMANKHVEKWAEDSMNADIKLCELVVQTLRLKYIFHSYAIGDIKYLKSEEYFFINKLIEKFGSRISKEPSLNNLDELVHEWADWAIKVRALQETGNIEKIKMENNQEIDYKTKAKKITDIIFQLVDKYIFLLLGNKDTRQYLSRYNNNNAVRFQLHLEPLFYFMFQIDRLAFSKLFVENKIQFIDEFQKCVEREMRKSYKDMFAETGRDVKEVIFSYNAVSEVYAGAVRESSISNEKPPDAWYYSRVVSKVLSNKEEDVNFIISIMTLTVDFMGKHFWVEIKPIFDDIE